MIIYSYPTMTIGSDSSSWLIKMCMMWFPDQKLIKDPKLSESNSINSPLTHYAVKYKIEYHRLGLEIFFISDRKSVCLLDLLFRIT
jgi:hypothetical protein